MMTRVEKVLNGGMYGYPDGLPEPAKLPRGWVGVQVIGA